MSRCKPEARHNAQFEGNGLTRSLHNSPNQQYGALETFTVETKPQLLSELRAQGVIDIIEDLRAF